MIDRALTVAYLLATPRMLREMTRDCSGSQAATPPKPGAWSIVDVVRHLVEGDRDTLLPRLRRLLVEERPTFAVFDPQAWEHERDHRARDFAADLAAFTRARADTLAFLERVPADAAGRLGVSGHFGPLTLLQYATHELDHDLEHLGQMRDCIGALPSRG